MNMPDRAQTLNNRKIATRDGVVKEIPTSKQTSQKNTIDDTVLQQCYDILEKGNKSPRYLSYVAIALEMWNQVNEWEGA